MKRSSSYQTDLDAVVRERSRRDIGFFASYFFPDYIKTDFSLFHADMFDMKREMDVNRKNYVVIAAPRGNAKSVIMTMVFTIHAIVFDLERFVVICSNTVAQAIERVTEIRDELENNEELTRIFGTFKTRKWNQDDFTSRNGVRVMAKGVGSEMRGTRNKADRPSLFIFDDLENSATVSSAALRNRTKVWFESVPMKAGYQQGPYATSFLYVGTVLHQQSLIADKMKSPRWRARKYQAVISWPTNTELWDEWRRIVTDLTRMDTRLDDARVFFDANEAAMMAGVEVLWPEGDPFYDLMLSIVDGGMAAFNAEKQNEPHDPEAQLFAMDKALTFTLHGRPGDPEAMIERSDGRWVKLGDLDIFGFLDPSMGKIDHAAITVLGVDRRYRDQYVLDTWLQKVPPSRQITQVFDLHQIWGFKQFGFEDNLFQALLSEPFHEEASRRGSKLSVKGIGHYKSKIERIASMEPDLANGWLLFSDHLRHTEYWNQFVYFPTATHDDGPDSTQAAMEVAGTSRLVVSTV